MKTDGPIDDIQKMLGNITLEQSTHACLKKKTIQFILGFAIVVGALCYSLYTYLDTRGDSPPIHLATETPRDITGHSPNYQNNK